MNSQELEICRAPLLNFFCWHFGDMPILSNQSRRNSAAFNMFISSLVHDRTLIVDARTGFFTRRSISIHGANLDHPACFS